MKANGNNESKEKELMRYRGMPFWAWNTAPDEEIIDRQVKDFGNMGFAGFIIHARNGLDIPYMGERFLNLVRYAVKRAKESGLKVWLYDEDRWPSGCAGGLVTKDRRYRQKSILFTKKRRVCVSPDEGKQKGETYLLASYSVKVDNDGYLVNSKQTDEAGANLFVYVMTAENNPRFNGEAYVDTMNPEAIAKFIEVTHEVYRKALGEDFGRTVEAIFTDEPQVIRLPSPVFSQFDLFEDVGFPWTEDFDETFEATFGENPIGDLPKLIWDEKDCDNLFRYRFNEHIAERFRTAYTAQIGAWCRTHGILFTGHFLNEDSMTLQSQSTRDVMRCYADEDILGIDVLRGNFEYETALQCASVKHQSGAKLMMSELYGVTNWTADFRDYMLQGNWQTALGVNVRVPHLSWMSMKGEGKRDYPATFGYQTPWYRDFTVIEDYFARIGKILSEGHPNIRIAVLHPVESYWRYCGAKDRTGQIRHARNVFLHSLCEWMLFGGFPFDFLNEALLPEQVTEADGTVSVGKMQYDVVVLPDCLNIRPTTLKALEKMQSHGVKIVIMGNVPKSCDGDTATDKKIADFAENCDRILPTREALLFALQPYRTYDLFAPDGENSRLHICSAVKNGDEQIFFLTPAKGIFDKCDTASAEYLFRIHGNFAVLRYDAMQNRNLTCEVFYRDGFTFAKLPLYAYDSVLLRLTPLETIPADVTYPEKSGISSELSVETPVTYRRCEDNVLLLDMPEYSLNGTDYMRKTEILHADGACRKALELPVITGKFAEQPWCITDDRESTVFLRFTFESEIACECRLGAEHFRTADLNGTKISTEPIGYYVDRDIKTYRLPILQKGKNVLTVEMEIGKKRGLEPLYLLGNFDVRLVGTNTTLLPPRDKIAYGSIVDQGMPFYGGSVVYENELETADGILTVSANDYAGAFVKVRLDGRAMGEILLPPYRLSFAVTAGKHFVELECIGNRHNTFGSLHWGIVNTYYGPGHWHKSGDAYCPEYKLRPFGVLKSPRFLFEEKKN